MNDMTVDGFIALTQELSETSKKADKVALIKAVVEKSKAVLDLMVMIVDPQLNIGFGEETFDEKTDTIAALELDGRPLSEFVDDVRGVLENNRTDEQIDTFIKTTCISVSGVGIARMIVSRTMRCGVSVSIINSIYPGTIFTPPYMRCIGIDKAKVDNWSTIIVQEKLDGMFVNLIQDGYGAHAQVRSRSWTDLTDKLLNEGDVILHEAPTEQYYSGAVLHGEILVWDEEGEGYLPREVGNAYINSDDVDKSRIRFIVWDMVPYDDFVKGKSDIPYKDRYLAIEQGREHWGLTGMRILASYIHDDLEAAKQRYFEYRRVGSEGVILKNPDGHWKDGTSKDQIKMKAIVDCDVRVVGWTKGVGKYADAIGSITVESSDGRLHCNVGSGLSDAQRFDIAGIEKIITEGGIATVRYNDVVDNEEHPDVSSLYLPRLVELRTDKAEPDSLERIIEQLNEV